MMKRRKPCPFCGSEPIVAEHAPKVNGEYQWMIACENPHCNFNPSAHGFVSSEYVIKAWNTRTPPVPCAICNRPEQDHSPVDSCCKGFAKDLADNQNSSG